MIRSYFFIAVRHLVSRRRQSLVTVLGLAIGVMVLISSISMMDGLMKAFIRQMLQVSPHITVKPGLAVPGDPLLLSGEHGLVSLAMPEAPDEDREIKNYYAVEEDVASMPGVQVTAPELLAEGFVIYGTIEESARVHGVIAHKQESIGALPDRVIDGDYEDFKAAPDGAVLGYKLAERLTAEVGDRVRAVGASGEIVSFRVSALMRTGMTSFDRSHLLVHLDRAQRLAGVSKDRVTGINVRVLDPDRVEEVAGRIERLLGRQALTWQEENANTLSLYTMMGSISYVLVVFTMIVAGLGVSNVLTTVVLQKAKDVAVLMSMGYPRSSVSLIFLIEGVALGTVGALAGCLLGYANTRLMGMIPMDFGESSVLALEYLYMHQSPWYYALSAAFGFMVSLIAGVAPARRAARLDPMEIIRQEI
jgi:lipoprotein-releasing system permease protein